MKYPDGQTAHLGDFVRLSEEIGRVVCSIDTNEYGVEHSHAQWGYLKEGVMIKFPRFGLIHYVEPEAGLELVKRA